MEVIIKLSDRKDKRYMAVFYDKDKKVKSIKDGRVPKGLKTSHFGYAITDDNGNKKYGSTYIDHKNDELKDAYIARHKVNEDFTNYMSSGSLSRYILWEKKTLRDAISDYKRRFKLD